MKKLIFLYLSLHLQALSADWHTIYAHGIVDDQTQINRFIDAISTQKTTAVQFSDAQNSTDWSFQSCIGSMVSKILGKPVNPANMHMGQANDIIRLQKIIENTPKNDNLILFGCSRGAATIINSLAESNSNNVKALVLDAIPSDIPATIKPFLANIGIHPNYANTIFSFIFPAYPKNSQTPLQAISKIINKNLPILLLHSKTDSKVSVIHSYKMYQEFVQQGFTNVHLIVLPEGAHSYLLQNEKVKELYLQAVHHFYKKYNLPYDAAWTKEEFNWKTYRPDNIERQIECYEKNIAIMYRKTLIKYATSVTIAAIITAALLLEQKKS